MKALLTVSAGLMLLIGVAWLVFPEAMFAAWGVEGSPVAVYMARRYGAMFFGYAAIFWLARGAEASRARAAVLAGGAVVSGVIALVSVAGLASGVVGAPLWGAFVVEAPLAAAFLYYVLSTSSAA